MHGAWCVGSASMAPGQCDPWSLSSEIKCLDFIESLFDVEGY